MEYVVTLYRADSQPVDATLQQAFDLYVEQIAPGKGGRGPLDEMRAAAERLQELRDNLGLVNEKLRVHVCRHDEGVGACTAVDV